MTRKAGSGINIPDPQHCPEVEPNPVPENVVWAADLGSCGILGLNVGLSLYKETVSRGAG
jgi:hypothetical protein